MPTTETHLFTLEQWQALNEEQKAAVEAVAIQLSDYGLTEQGEMTDELISTTLNLLRPCTGCVPDNEIALREIITEKFSAVFDPCIQLAEQELNRRGVRQFEHYSFCLIVQPSIRDATHIVIMDYQRPVCYLHEWIKGCHFHFSSLAALADKVLSLRDQLVEKVSASHQPPSIFVVVEEGYVKEVVGLPEGSQVTVLDYDMGEEDEPRHIEPSPLDGELCCITKF